MSPEETPPKRIAVIWSPEARADLRAIDRETALQILHCLDRYLLNRDALGMPGKALEHFRNAESEATIRRK